MKIKYANICLFLVSILVAMALAGCADENFFEGSESTGGDLTMSFSCNDMLPQYSDPITTQTRAIDPKTEEEKKINSLHLFFFAPNADGKLVFVRPKLNDQSFLPYMYIANATDIVTVKQDVFETMENVTVVAIANINATDDPTHSYFCTEWTPDGAIRKDSREFEGTEAFMITSYDDLKEWIYHPRLRRDEGRSISELPSAGMPMIGVAENVSLVKSATNTRLEIQLRALMARVNISIKLNPNQQSTDGALPTIRITSYGIKNMPQTVPFSAPTAEYNSATKTYDLTNGNMDDAEYVLPSPVIINKDSKPVTFSYYTYENVQLPDYEALKPDDSGKFFPDYNVDDGTGTTPTYPKGVKEEDYQRWKPTMARDNASALILKGVYTTHQGVNYRAQFTIYMGSNTVDDFRVCRNHEYNNNIFVHGLDYVRNSTDDVYTFDARVNVVSDNPIYIAMVNERKVDAHATALPMDIWLMPREPQDGKDPDIPFTTTVSLEILPDNNAQDWMQMVLIPRKDMEANGFAAGTGLSKYFYTDMIDKCKSGTVDGHKSGPKIEIECLPSNDPNYENMSRSRIYFYIDENVPTTEKLASSSYGDRMARVKLTYSTSEGVKYERIIEIEQRALVHVVDPDRAVNAWMEYYEEYLEHNDPLDKHTEEASLYNGLPWGETLYNEAVRRVAGLSIDGCDVYLTDDAYRYTKGILARDGAVPLSDYTLHSKPATAFHYCYGRNKRDEKGLVELDKSWGTPTLGAGWYMPGIRELEAAMVKFYLEFDDFNNKENLYLSAACGKSGGLWPSENTSTARATRVKNINSDGSVEYEESTTGNLGAVDRRKPYRIRAFYRLEK